MRPKPKPIVLDPAEMALVCWGRPDSPRRPFCGRCHAYLSEHEVPVMLWRRDGSAISLCDSCFARMTRVR